MDHWHGFGPELNVAQTYKTTISDKKSGLSAHFVVVPARSLGSESYLFGGSVSPLESLGLQNLVDIPLGGVARSLAACLVSPNEEVFLDKFERGFSEEVDHPSITPLAHFGFAEYLTFARVIPFEWPAFSTDSLGNILTSQGRGKSGYMKYENAPAPIMVIAIPAGILLCGSTPGLTVALRDGLRDEVLGLIRKNSPA